MLLLALAPPTVTTGPLDDAGPPDTVRLRPAAQRATGGPAHVSVAVGDEVPGDVLVRWRSATPAVGEDGAVTAGPDAADGVRLGAAGGRLRPGETLATTVHVTGDRPVLVLAEVVPVADPEGAPTVLTALVLPGPAPPDPPTVTTTVEAEGLAASITATRPTLVAARVVGGSTTTAEDRLVLPDRPVVLVAAAPRWPLPGSVAVVDELGRVVRVQVGDGPAQLGAAALVLLTAATVTVAARRHRRRRDAASSVS